MKKVFLLIFSVLTVAQSLSAQSIHGTVRGKYEYQTQEGEGRFEVRNARVSVDGSLLEIIDYKAEIDLCDEGSIKMLDAFAALRPFRRERITLTIGQMRVPFTIDAHRSPHRQFFANRSFIAKQVGNVRDVGTMAAWEKGRCSVEFGLFNGSGLTNQKNFWTKNVNFSGKFKFNSSKNFGLVLSAQRIKPSVAVMMYDVGVYWQRDRWHAEAEYLLKHYGRDAFANVHAFNAFAAYEVPLRTLLFTRLTPLVRYDYMSDHSDGAELTTTDDGERLTLTDAERHRLTAGATLSFGRKAFEADLRLNVEKYWYPDGEPKTSEKDKLVLEMMVHF